MKRKRRNDTTEKAVKEINELVLCKIIDEPIVKEKETVKKVRFMSDVKLRRQL